MQMCAKLTHLCKDTELDIDNHAAILGTYLVRQENGFAPKAIGNGHLLLDNPVLFML